MSQKQHPRPSNGDSERTRKSSASVGESIEALLSDLLGMVGRYLRTVGWFSLMPARTARVVCLQSPDYHLVIRPFTFLLIGCLLYSFLLGGIDHATSSKFTTYVAEIARDVMGSELSLTALLVRALPLVIVTSLFATIAGALTRPGGELVRVLMVYLYGLQGSLLLLFVLAMPPLGDVFQTLLGSDDYLIAAFLLLVVGACTQGYRVFRHVINAAEERRKARLLMSLAFPLLFLVPVPLAGYLAVWTDLIPAEVERPPRERRLAPVRIVETGTATIGRESVDVALSALIENQSERPFLVSQRGLSLELYLVPLEELNRVSWSPQPDRRAIPSLSSFDHHRLRTRKLSAHVDESEVPTVLSPGEAAIIEFDLMVEGSGAWLETRRRYEQGQPIRQPPETSDQSWDELAEGRSLLVRLTMTDSTSGKRLASEYFRVGP